MTASRSNYHWLLVRSLLRSAASTATLLTVYYLAPLDHTRSAAILAFLGLGLVVFTALIIWQVRAITEAEHPRLRAVESLSVAVPLLLVVFAGVNVLVERAHPGSFSEPLNHTDGLYFTLTVFATVGFGDIVPVTGTARVITMVQMCVDLLAVGVIAKAIFGAVQMGLRQKPDQDRGPTT
ncbi:potassium channel family protein [Streptomyces sp. NBC_01262]|uniref:potassium channel family protein n=1 Tax=Streptomyces sp. NBC_01262 TaxID=2903803 RepID=UPI002E2EC215|nr:potassium channel family protein [Streptomyces sp. NBC_01262]